MVVLLAGRIPVVERTLGQDRLTRWHRLLAPWSLVLIALHGALITVGLRPGARSGLLHQFGQLISTYPGILTATVAFCLLMAAGLTSARIARRRMRYETWWAVHLYTYLALALSFSHQLATGASFVGHPVARDLVDRAVDRHRRDGRRLPDPSALWRTLFHNLRVVAVEPEGRIASRSSAAAGRLHRLPLSGGQFFQWRFLKRGSVVAGAPLLGVGAARPAVPALHGQGSRRPQRRAGSADARAPGWRSKGPYGAFTADARAETASL